MSHIEHIPEPEGMPPSVGYSHVVAGTGRLVAIAGQVAMDASGELVGPNDAQAQAERVFANLARALSAAGATFRDVIKLGVFVTDIAILPVVREFGTATWTPLGHRRARLSRSAPYSGPGTCWR
jgi:enamine deaminase RidA (YjgF/YER057c/UK114 family)